MRQEPPLMGAAIMIRRCLAAALIACICLISARALAQDLGGLTTINNPLAYSVYTRQRAAQQQRLGTLSRQVKSLEVRASKRIGEAAPRSGFQNQGDYF